MRRENGFLFRHCERSEAIQILSSKGLDCFVAEPVIGPATSGRTRWLLAMTRIGREERSSFPSPLEGEGAERALASEAGEGFARKRVAKNTPLPVRCALLLATRHPLPQGERGR